MDKKRLFRWIKVLVLLYCIIGIAVYYTQDMLLFHPAKMDAKTAYSFNQPFTELSLTYDKETRLSVVEFRAIDRPADSPAKGVVLFFHGNSGNIARYAHHAPDFTGKGYEVWMIDYPGFGKSTGPRDEQSLYKYALVFYKLARSRWKADQIVICGRSLGTGIATELASVRDCRRLILESPYYSMLSMFRRYLPIYPVGKMLHYRFPTNEFLPRVIAPVTIFHGDDDNTIPYSNSVKLRSLLKPGDEYITVGGAGHDNLHDFPVFRAKLDSVMSR